LASPAVAEESAQMDALYADGRAKGIDREPAARQVIMRVLVSPNYPVQG